MSKITFKYNFDPMFPASIRIENIFGRNIIGLARSNQRSDRSFFSSFFDRLYVSFGSDYCFFGGRVVSDIFLRL